ncbi:MAG: hypothetical protein ACI88S_002156, partial [Ilumatobacter sp.]
MSETTGPPASDPVAPTALEALRALATSEVAITELLRHREVYTPRGLLSVLWHEPSAPVPAAIVM